MSWISACSRRSVTHLGLALCCAWGALNGDQAHGQLVPGARDSIPNSEYWSIFDDYHDGNYVPALRSYRQAGMGAMKAGASYWIDSICYQTMAGECCYQMGKYNDALNHYDAALNLYVTYSTWLIQVQFQPTLNPSSRNNVAPWGKSTRGVQPAQIPDKIPIAQGSFGLVPAGGNLFTQQAPQMRGINVKEIVRCTCLAMRRKREILGPTGPFDKLTDQVVTAAVQPGQPGHWSTCWNDLQLGLAYCMAGKDAQAKPVLNRAVLAGGQLDHDLTCMALFELGRIALNEADFDTAASSFEEAGYSAYFYNDLGMVEESLRYGFLTHLLSNRPGLYPPLASLSSWSTTKTPRQLRASALVMSAESSCVLGEPDAASAALSALTSLIIKSNLSLGRLGARANFVTALHHYLSGNVGKGDAALQQALNFQINGGSLWLFHIELVDEYYKENSDKWRTASQLFEHVLRDPTPADWLSDPLEAISALATPKHTIYEHWFELAINPRSKQPDIALEVADALKRHKFLSSTLLGGRTLALRWLLDAPDELLSQKAIQEKKDLLTKYADYAALSKEAAGLRDALRDLPLVPDEPDVKKVQADKLNRLTEVTAIQEVMLRQISIRRDAASITFPGRIKTKELQAKLPERTALLAFAVVNHEVWAFLISKDRYEPWKLGTADSVISKVGALLQKMGNHEGNAAVPSDKLNSDWQKPARDIMTALFSASRQSLPGDLDELIIVPDGVLWYLPFEALPVASGAGKQTQPLITKTKIRYVPFCASAMPDNRGRPIGKHIAVASGKLHPNSDRELADEHVQEIVQGVNGAALLQKPLPAGSAILSTLFDGMMVFDDLGSGQIGYALAPLSLDKNKPYSTLDDWLGLPWHGPDHVLLPGFHSAAENAINAKKSKTEPGLDIFLPVCGLMASGSRTVLLSRWRTGGASSFHLLKEFSQELPHTSAASSWQRSVQLVMDEPVDTADEPRLNAKNGNGPANSSHPFFWAGYVLVDTGTPAERSEEKPAGEPAPVAKKPKAKPANPADVGEKVDKPGGKPIKPPANPPAKGAQPPEKSKKGLPRDKQRKDRGADEDDSDL